MANAPGQQHAEALDVEAGRQTIEHLDVAVVARPRVQVEHTVTELVTMRNLVQYQIRVAQGHKLNDPEIGIKSQKDIELRGYAIQSRITTEDPKNNFLPSFGRITRYFSPGGHVSQFIHEFHAGIIGRFRLFLFHDFFNNVGFYFFQRLVSFRFYIQYS